MLRQAVKDDPNFPMKGTVIRAGAAILVHLAEMNLRPDLWPMDADKFLPKRFLPSLSTSNANLKEAVRTTTSNPKNKTFFPFGDGPKGCIGMHLGRREVAAIVETVIANYNLSTQCNESLESLQTHWDIANQPDNPVHTRISPMTQ